MMRSNACTRLPLPVIGLRDCAPNGIWTGVELRHRGFAKDPRLPFVFLSNYVLRIQDAFIYVITRGAASWC